MPITTYAELKPDKSQGPRVTPETQTPLNNIQNVQTPAAPLTSNPAITPPAAVEPMPKHPKSPQLRQAPPTLNPQ